MNMLYQLRKQSLSAVALMLTSTMYLGTAQADITGSAHDFSASIADGQVCVACHVPHNSDTTVADAPLWSQTLTTQTFTMYTGPGSLDGAIDAQPTGVSKLCLSCHDGVTGMDSFGGANMPTQFVGTTAVLGTSLNDDHPISIVYDSVTDTGLFDPATGVTVGLATATTKARTGTIAGLMLDGSNKVQCASCHDVHNNYTGDTADYAPLLKVKKSNSSLCLTCHDK